MLIKELDVLDLESARAAIRREERWLEAERLRLWERGHIWKLRWLALAAAKLSMDAQS